MAKGFSFGAMVTLLAGVFCYGAANAEVPEQKVKAFMAAFERVYQPTMNKDDVERYLSFMTDDVTDFHASYNVTLTGKDLPRKTLPEKAKTSVAYKLEVGEMILGERTAVLEYREIFRDRDGAKVVDGNLRTILVLEFSKDGLIKNMRRYLDR